MTLDSDNGVFYRYAIYERRCKRCQICSLSWKVKHQHRVLISFTSTMRLTVYLTYFALAMALPSERHHKHRRALTWDTRELVRRDTSTTETGSVTSKTSSSTSTSKSTSVSSSTSSKTSPTTSKNASATSTATTAKSSETTTKSKTTKSSSSSTSTSSTSSSSSASGTTSMPQMSPEGMPTISETSLLAAPTSIEIFIPAGGRDSSKDSLKYPSNPFIKETSLPNGLIFIILGTIVGTLIAVFVVYRLVLWFYARKLAKIGKENEYNNFDFRGFSDIGSNLSFFDGASLMARPLSRRNSMMMLPPHLSTASLVDLLTLSGGSDRSSSGNEKGTMSDMTTSQGHSYRDFVTGNTKRGSMFISPVMAMMNNDYNSGVIGDLASYYDYFNSSSLVLGGESPSLTLNDESSSASSSALLLKDPEKKETEGNHSTRGHTRPPSQYLEDLLDSFE